MKIIIAVKTLLLCIVPISILACAGLEGQSDRQEVHIVSAHRFAFKSKAVDGSEISNQYLGRATEEILPMLEEAILRGARNVPHRRVFFPGRGGRGGFGERALFWIRCNFDNGEEVDIR